MSDTDGPQYEDSNTSRNVLSFGCELEFIVAYVIGDEPDPDADDEHLAPILRLPGDIPSEFSHDYIYKHMKTTLRDAGLTLQDDDLPLPPDVDEQRARAIFGISVKHDDSLHEGNIDKTWNGYRFQGVEVNSSASWTSTIAFQELELLIQVLLHNYRIRVNQSCGLQFHIGNGLRPLNTQTVKRVAALLWCLDPIGCHIHPPQRRRGQYSLPIREHSRLARGLALFNVEDNETFFREGTIGKPNLGGSAPLASSRPARVRRFPSSRLATSRAAPGPHQELEQNYPDGFGDRELLDIPDKDVDVDSALDGVWRCLACSTTDKLPALLGVMGKPNYSFTGYEPDMNPEDRDEWYWDLDPECKLTIEFREAVGSMDAQWITCLGRICASIVLFALNSSTTEFFGMLMRLAQAQGDFGDAGPAPYDFIDFLDDIGCFAEAELLEGRLQDKKLFWFPCRKLEGTATVQDPYERAPPRRWRLGFGNENEQSSSNQPPVSAEDLWGTEDPAESAAESPKEEWPTEEEYYDASEQSSPMTEKDSAGLGDKNPTESPDDDANRPKGPTEEGQKMADQEPEAMTQEQKAARAAAEKAATEKEIREAYMRSFPHGYERILTSAHGLLCGLRALIASIVAQEPERLYPPPAVEDLQDLLSKNPFFQDFIETSRYKKLEKDKNNFTADQLGGVLHVWGESLKPPRNLRLGIVRPLQGEMLLPAPDGDQIIIWVYNDDAQSESEWIPIIGHYEGLRPIAEPAVDLKEVDLAEQKAIADSFKSTPIVAQGVGVVYEEEEEEEL
ncbi:hypothetical protein CONLIGDRAFT_121852 [Coniochaeta ligniaria NRRL 30616]|uniref:Uncharacterized protein n=1 Tax=Coniochaeta ligniaria NRRL 30616 TaxID=1408157 RepID=A0A1J7ISG2_9PEZI|nr:hypothetical protein CONLIGDRAFT_121852 [Coniochaeta ligniaria NRRL 30616]